MYRGSLVRHLDLQKHRTGGCARLRLARSCICYCAFIALLPSCVTACGVKKATGRIPMQAQEQLEGAANRRYRPLHTCPYCEHVMQGAIAAEYLSASDIWNVWQCDNCDQISRTSIGPDFIVRSKAKSGAVESTGSEASPPVHVTTSNAPSKCSTAAVQLSTQSPQLM